MITLLIAVAVVGITIAMRYEALRATRPSSRARRGRCARVLLIAFGCFVAHPATHDRARIAARRRALLMRNPRNAAMLRIQDGSW